MHKQGERWGDAPQALTPSSLEGVGGQISQGRVSFLSVHPEVSFEKIK